MRFSEAGFTLARPLLHALDPEQAHGLTIKALKLAPSTIIPSPTVQPHLASQLWGLKFPNPLGLAAGFDKNAEAPEALLRLGFGFVEVGTVTPEPQVGNPKPRLFRLAADQAVINRMGFNNAGHHAMAQALQHRRKELGIIGVNIGANKDSADRTEDYVKGISAFSDLADYFTVNISSPNTPGLRNLQAAEELNNLLQRLNEARAKQQKQRPMLLKIAPDLTLAELEDVARCCEKQAIDGVILTNTTITRPPLTSPDRTEAGGLSGAPLFELSTRRLAQFYQLTEGKIPLVGVGGIASAEQAWEKICAGAALIQIYSALVFQGPALISKILTGLNERLKTTGLASVAQATGSRAKNYSLSES